MGRSVWAIRGATTVARDTPEEVFQATQELLPAMLDANGLGVADVISIVFTATEDIKSTFPAAAARSIGFEEVPLMCAREMDVEGSLPLCVRVLMHVSRENGAGPARWVYLRGATVLREDL